MKRMLACLALVVGGGAIGAEAERNFFGDPFVQATLAIPACPVPAGPLSTERERRAEAHWRVERGTSCFRAGRCRLANSYLYDAELVPRVARFIQRSGRFDDTSVWVEGQRRWIWLKGCVRDAKQAAELERAVRGVDDVEAVIPSLTVGTTTRAPYRVAAP